MKLKEFIEFNSLKHHLNYARKISYKIAKPHRGKFIEELNNIGNNTLDLYIGKLSIKKIKEEFINKITLENLTTKVNLENYVGNDGFRKIEISDGSRWILRLGTMKKSFIHIHPARYKNSSIRINGAAWKTAIAVLIFEDEINELTDLLKKVNYVRSKYLKLSPVKTLKSNSNIVKTLHILRK